MIFAFVFTVCIGICAVALIGLEDSHYRVTRLLQELDEQAALHPAMADQTTPLTNMTPAQQPAEALSGGSGDMSFTHSLLALNRVDSLVPCDSPISAPAESSSSESAHPVQSKDHVQVL